MFLQEPLVEKVERLGLDGAFKLKANQPELLRQAERFTAGPPAGVEPEPDRQLPWRLVPQFDWPAGERLVRAVKTVRTNCMHEITVRAEDNRPKRKNKVAKQSANFDATNFVLGAISPLFIHQLGRSRWRIDTEEFQTLTTECHLKHPDVHQSTALVLTLIRLLAYTLSRLFYQRQICSHARGRRDTFHEFAKRLTDWFVALAPDTS